MYNRGRSTSHSTGSAEDPSKLVRMHHQLYLYIAAAVKTSLCQIFCATCGIVKQGIPWRGVCCSEFCLLSNTEHTGANPVN